MSFPGDVDADNWMNYRRLIKELLSQQRKTVNCMKSFFSILSFIIVCSCNSDQPFLHHALQAEKIGDCSQQPGNYKVESNNLGERYEFTACLDANFNEKDYSVTRKGDTILLQLPAGKAGATQALYKITLDIDAKPRYNHILLGNQLLEVVPAGN